MPTLQPFGTPFATRGQLRVSRLCLVLLLLPYGSCTNGNSYELAPHKVVFNVPV